MRRIWARAPNHLGDGVMALPALAALARSGPTTIAAPAWGPLLYRDLPARVVPRSARPEGDVAVLFPPSFRVAWEARHLPRRVGTPTDSRRLLLTDAVRERIHRRDTYAALVGALGLQVAGPPAFALRPEDRPDPVPDGHVGLNPISVSGAVVEWPGFASLARRIEGPVLWYAGPGEEDRLATVAGEGPRCVGLPLDRLAATLARCAVFVSNDSGAAHFARACGVPTVVVHGSTAAARTGPHGAIPVEGPDPGCRPCYGKRCRRGLGCLEVGVEEVLDAIARAGGTR